jgi:hypothetical protein
MYADTGLFYENLDPYITLRLLAENPKNLERDIIWRFEDYHESNPEDKTPIHEGLLDSDRFLIVTEGTSGGKQWSQEPFVSPYRHAAREAAFSNNS